MLKIVVLTILALGVPVGVVAAQMLKKYLNLKIEEKKRKLFKDYLDSLFK